MSSVFGQNNLWKAAIFASGVMFGFLATPIWKEAIIYLKQDTYGQLVFKCNSAMQSHLLAKHRVAATPSKDTVRILAATEVGLLACQEYDLERKQLIQFGLTENELAKMALNAIEANATNLREVVKTHEFRY